MKIKNYNMYLINVQSWKYAFEKLVDIEKLCSESHDVDVYGFLV